MDVRQLEALLAVAEAGSFAEASRQLRISRSVMTARIQQLESFVGAPLFLRNTRSVKLTDLGETFLHDCIELVSRTNEVVDQMRDVGTSPAGRLRIHAGMNVIRTSCATNEPDAMNRAKQMTDRQANVWVMEIGK